MSGARKMSEFSGRKGSTFSKHSDKKPKNRKTSEMVEKGSHYKEKNTVSDEKRSSQTLQNNQKCKTTSSKKYSSSRKYSEVNETNNHKNSNKNDA